MVNVSEFWSHSEPYIEKVRIHTKSLIFGLGGSTVNTQCQDKQKLLKLNLESTFVK